MPARVRTIYVGNDGLLTVDELTNLQTGNYLNGSTVTVTLYEPDGTTEVTGETWPLTLPYVAASNGKYQATLADTLVLVKGRKYQMKVESDSGAGLKGKWTVPVKAIERFE